MKLIKSVALVGLGLIVILAFAGTSLAVASGTTALCKVNQTPCAAGNLYPGGTKIEAKSTNALLASDLANVLCKKSTATLVTLAAAGTDGLPGEITAWKFEECIEETSGASCTVTTINLPYATSLLHTVGTMDGVLTVKNGGKGEPGATVSCPLLKCVFTAEPSMTLDGATGTTEATAARVLAVGIKLKLSTREGFLECPKEATWTATYIDTTPASPIYVSA
ncbi:MAG TPA: hypothetical protein VGC63_00165 [Solirubrobacterales bacterium]|jgi:hypothetical protein